MKDKKKVTLLFILTLVCAVVLTIVTLNHINYFTSGKNKVNVKLNKEETLVEIVDFSIIPGEEVVYQVKSDIKKDTTVHVEIYFTDVSEEIGNSLNVYTKQLDKVSSKKSVLECTQLNKLKSDFYLTKENNVFNVIFEMSADAGNEFQNKSFDFNTYIKVSG